MDFPALEGGITTLVFVYGTMVNGFPIVGLCLVLELAPLINETTWVGGFPPMVEDMGEPD